MVTQFVRPAAQPDRARGERGGPAGSVEEQNCWTLCRGCWAHCLWQSYFPEVGRQVSLHDPSTAAYGAKGALKDKDGLLRQQE